MAVLIIQTNEDGTVSIAAPAQVPPELLADAEQVGSLDEAAQVLVDVLGAEPSELAKDPEGGETATEEVAAPQASTEDAMEQGFRNVRGAPR
jgi:hypothetical protein